MKIIKKIVAFFKINGQPQQMELSSAEIRDKGVFLHPANDPKHTFFVQPESVDIILNPDDELSEEDFTVVDRENTTVGSKDLETISKASEKETEIRPLSLAKFMPRKRRFTIMVYPDEYDMLMKNIVNKGYKKAEYFLACVNASKKQSWESEYKSIANSHKVRLQTDKDLARQAQEQDLLQRQQAVK